MSKKVLIVEDEAALSHALSLKLQAAGFAVDVARDGQAALDSVDANNYDLILLDIIMPVLDGFQVLEHLQKLEPMPKVLVLSNLAQPDDEQRVLALGATGYLVKSDTPLVAIANEVSRLLSKG